MDNFSEARLGMFTASEMHKLMTSSRDKKKMFGDTAMSYIYDKITETLNLEPAPQINKWELQWGIDNEAAALEWFTKITGKELEIYGATNYKFFDYNQYSGCSPDAIVKGESANVQVKCPANSSNHTKYLFAPQEPTERQQWLKSNYYDYYVQCQFEMMCCKTDKCYFIVYDPRRDEGKYMMAVFELSKDVELCDEIDIRLTEAQRIKKELLAQLQQIPDIQAQTKAQAAREELAHLEKQWEAEKTGAAQSELFKN